MTEETRSLGRRLERLIAKVLEISGYLIIERDPASAIGVDFIVTDETHERFGVEVKLYRSSRIDTRVLRNAAAQLGRLKKTTGMKAIFVATASFDESQTRLLRNIGIDSIWDISEIRRRASISPELSLELEKLFRDAELRYIAPSPGEEGVVAEGDIEHDGERLIKAFESTEAGNADAHKFEKLCQESIDYLFGKQFGQFQPQNRVEHGFQRMDLIARLTPDETGVFWISLAQDFRCRYVVFEFKNYADKIAQNQIYTTEKYLYPNALRSVAIIVARNGYDSGARRAIQGALREASKVIIVLSLEDIFKLIQAKDSGLEPSDLLFEYLDNLLTTMAP
jgi:Holliday junction resolvase-like predicted endonuclease